MCHKSKSSFLIILAVLVVVTMPAFGASTGSGDDGTKLTVTVDTPVVTCNQAGTGATVTANYTVVSTGSADSAVMTASIGDTVYSLPTIASGSSGWAFAGRTKTAEGTFSTDLTNGTYTLTICATQSGAGGRLPKSVCSLPLAVTVNCVSPDPCANVGPFGEVPNNRNLCSANGHVEIQFRGSFGEAASLVIAGPDGFSLPVSVDRAGDSCNYHYNWDPAAGQAAGTYTFTVNGSLSWSADLICDSSHGGGPPQ
jgi:hypothetical protein